MVVVIPGYDLTAVKSVPSLFFKPCYALFSRGYTVGVKVGRRAHITVVEHTYPIVGCTFNCVVCVYLFGVPILPTANISYFSYAYRDFVGQQFKPAVHISLYVLSILAAASGGAVHLAPRTDKSAFYRCDNIGIL